MSGFDESLRKIIRRRREEGKTFETHFALMSGLEEAVRFNLGDATEERNPVTREPLLRIDVGHQRTDSHITIAASDGKSLEIRLLTTGALLVTTPELEIEVAEFKVFGRSGMQDVDFSTAAGKKFSLRELFDRFFGDVLRDIEGI